MHRRYGTIILIIHGQLVLGFSEIYLYLYYFGAVLDLRTCNSSVPRPNPYREHVLPIGVESRSTWIITPLHGYFAAMLALPLCPFCLSLSLSVILLPPLEMLCHPRRLRRSLSVVPKRPVHHLPLAMGSALFPPLEML